MTELAGASLPTGSAPVSVSVRDLHVRYRVFEERPRSAGELFRSGFQGRPSIDVHALRGVTFEVHTGESVGLVGPNGSGKSTLLRCIAGLQQTAAGAVFVRGQAQLLAVTAALDPALSGRRNILLGGLAMGLSLDEVQSALPEVIKFSGIGDAINRPLKTYSSGMRSRLAFSIATIRTPEILLIDEALAVGDREFREASLQRVREICAAAKTVIMVTHNLQEIRTTCSRAIWLDEGQIVADGAVDDVLASYEAS